MQDDDPEQTDERLFFFSETSGEVRPAPADKKSKVNPNAGHRDRLRERFAKAGRDGVADYELLEMLLYRSLPRIDTKPIAKDLLQRFGSFGDVLGADIHRLEEVKGIKHAMALDLKIVAAAAKEMLKSSVQTREILASWASVLEYCTAAMAYESKEQFRILFLDKKNGLIADEVQQMGTVDHTPVYPREVLKRAIELSATAVILLHNHPSGDPTPSSADISMTQKIIEAMQPLGIIVHDHIIIGKNGHASLKGLQLI